MMIKLAIFDFDGTLADTFSVFAESVNVLAARHGFRQVAHDEVNRLRGLSASEILRELQLPVWRVPKVLSDFRDMMQQRISEIRPFNGICNALQTMADQDITLALATSNSFRNTEAVLGQALMHRFAAIECGSPLFNKARCLRRILQLTHTDKSHAIYIGDEIRDAHAARKIGIQFGAVAWGYTEFDALSALRPDATFHKPVDLLNLVTPRQ